MTHKPISSPTKLHHLNLNKFNYRSKPHPSINEITDQDFRIYSLEISEHGKTGVFFIQTDFGSFVLKSSNDGPKDQFLNRLAAMMSLNVPQSICFCCSDKIFHKLIFQIQKYCQKDEVLFARIKTKLDYPFYQILQYIPSVSLTEIGKQRLQTYLIHPQKLYSLGMCLGYDMIMNNSDRFKLIWRGDGNVNNILIKINDHDRYETSWIKNRNNTTVQLNNYVFIDHSGNLIDLKNSLASKNFESYMEKVGTFYIGIIKGLSQQVSLPNEFDNLIKQFQFYTHYSLSNYDLRMISHGIIYVTKKFLDLFEGKSIEELYKNLVKQQDDKGKKRIEVESDYWNRYWNIQFGKVNLGYLQEVYNKIAAIFSTYPEIIKKIIEQVGDIDEAVGNNKFNNINQIMDIQGNQEKASVKSKEEMPGQQGESQVQIQPRKSSAKLDEKSNNDENRQQDPFGQINPQKGQIKESRAEKYKPQPEIPQKQRKWRQKLQKFKQNNSNHY